jgi:hypothetical protein
MHSPASYIPEWRERASSGPMSPFSMDSTRMLEPHTQKRRQFGIQSRGRVDNFTLMKSKVESCSRHNWLSASVSQAELAS